MFVNDFEGVFGRQVKDLRLRNFVMLGILVAHVTAGCMAGRIECMCLQFTSNHPVQWKFTVLSHSILFLAGIVKQNIPDKMKHGNWTGNSCVPG